MSDAFTDGIRELLAAIESWEQSMPHYFIDCRDLPPGVSPMDTETNPAFWQSISENELKHTTELPLIRIEAAARATGRTPLFNKARRFVNELAELASQYDRDADKYVFRRYTGDPKDEVELHRLAAMQWQHMPEQSDHPLPVEKIRAMITSLPQVPPVGTISSDNSASPTGPSIDVTCAAARLDTSERSVRNWCNSGTKPCHNAFKQGNTWRIPESDIPA